MPHFQSSRDSPERGVDREPDLTVKVLHSFADAEPHHSEWNELVLRSGADVYQTYEWCSAWWRYYGSGRELNLLLLFSENRLIGMVPAFVETLWLGLVRVRAAKLVGADFSLQLCNLPVMPDFLEQVVLRAVRYFLASLKCDVFLIGPLSGPAARMDGILDAVRNKQDCVGRVECLGNSISTRFDLPEDFAAYLDRIGGRQRGNFNRSVKQFAKNHQVVEDVVSGAADVPGEFENFKIIHETQWAAEAKLGHFGDWPRAAEFNRDLVDCLGKLGMVRFFRILADGKVASSQFCFRFGETNYWRLPGRASNPEWEKLSLGKMGLIRMIEASLAEGMTVVEGGRGHYGYKVQLCGEEWPLRTIQFTRRGRWVHLRVRLFRICARLLDLAYYRLLFIRLAPKFPLLRHSLWPVWIRTTW